MEIYSLDNEIRSFFNGNLSTSRKKYDDLARSLLGGEPVVPFPIHRQCSYTVCSPQAVTEVIPGGNGSSHPVENAKIVQFRLNRSKIDIYVAQLAKAAETDYYGEIGRGGEACLCVYVIEKLPGITYIEMENFSVEMSAEMATSNCDWSRIWPGTE